MTFEVIPTLGFIKDLYHQPIAQQRFQHYLEKLQSDKNDLNLPIMGFNPMAKGVAKEKLQSLLDLHAEQLAKEAIDSLNDQWKEHLPLKTIRVVLNLADDVGGAWTNHYTTDYSSKFDIKPLVNRLFCAPHFWTSEHYTAHLIKERTIGYASRTIYALLHSLPQDLEGYLDQEIFVAQQLKSAGKEVSQESLDLITTFYEKHKHSSDYSLCFNFFYGDLASHFLGFPSYGVGDFTGFEWANYLAVLR